MKISLWDEEFRHIGFSYTGYQKPSHFEWDRDNYNNDIVVYTERCYDKVFNAPKGKINICWMLEPPSIHKYAYDDILNKYKGCFDYAFNFSYDYMEKFMANGLKSVTWSPGGSYVYPNDWQIYEKTKNIQIIASAKKFALGHILRHDVIRKYRDKIDLVCGRGYQKYDYQLDVLKDFRFAIVIENCDIENYWSDKLLDCFLTGTVPIMYNSGWIRNYFNTDGIILWQDKNKLGNILDTLNEDLYNRMIPAIQENFKIAKEKYSIVEDNLYMNFFKEFDNADRV